eukprot:TRINITY_DN40396_c0_g1_i1.p1 TRINITY_DN40396_c0_g1~~TRINITY_DN40396_c0_g1_i1.p1  ORF type:complete len:421 (+),score=112.59 TRINITY_DN40396_c0_g1_i1:53-1264(+)
MTGAGSGLHAPALSGSAGWSPPTPAATPASMARLPSLKSIGVPESGLGLFGSRQRATAVLSFAACSSTMLVFNKLAVQKVGLPAALISFQMLAAVIGLHVASSWGYVALDTQSYEKLRGFVLPVITFTGSVFCNVNGLQYSNVETFVVFRCSTPIVASMIEGCCGDRMLPSVRSWLAMAMVFGGAVTFVLSNGTFRVYSQLWVIHWYVFTVADALVLRSFIQSVEMSPWSRAYWYNCLALPFFIAAAAWNGELSKITDVRLDAVGVIALGASTLVGLFISYTSFILRGLTSAATFLIVATVCKVVTIVLSIAIWKQVGSLFGIGGLLTCIIGGALYQESPMRPGGQSAERERKEKADRAERGVKEKADRAERERKEKAVDGPPSPPHLNASVRTTPNSQPRQK